MPSFLDSLHAWKRHRLEAYVLQQRAMPPDEQVLATMRTRLAPQNQHILDYGSGGGEFAARFATWGAAHVYAYDPSEIMRSLALPLLSQHPNTSLISDLSTMPAASIDVFFCRRVLPYVDWETLFADVTRLLKPGGLLYLEYHSANFYWHHLRHHKRLLRPLFAFVHSALYHTTSRRLDIRIGSLQLNDLIYTREDLLQRTGYTLLDEQSDPLTPGLYLQRPIHPPCTNTTRCKDNSRSTQSPYLID